MEMVTIDLQQIACISRCAARFNPEKERNEEESSSHTDQL